MWLYGPDDRAENDCLMTTREAMAALKLMRGYQQENIL